MPLKKLISTAHVCQEQPDIDPHLALFITDFISMEFIPTKIPPTVHLLF